MSYSLLKLMMYWPTQFSYKHTILVLALCLWFIFVFHWWRSYLLEIMTIFVISWGHISLPPILHEGEVVCKPITVISFNQAAQYVDPVHTGVTQCWLLPDSISALRKIRIHKSRAGSHGENPLLNLMCVTLAKMFGKGKVPLSGIK